MKTVILTKPAIIASTRHAAGAELALSDATADWLIQHAQAKLTPEKASKSRKTETIPAA